MNRPEYHLILALMVILFVLGCSKTYVPQIVLPVSERTIDAVVEMHSLQAAPKLRSGHDTYGVLAPKVETPSPKELTDQLTTALLEDFDSDQVFSRLSIFEPNPDLILTGRVDKFYQHDRPRLWSYAPYAETFAWLFRVNTYVSSGEVDLTVMLLKAGGEVVGRYRGREKFDETYRPNDDLLPGERLNHAFFAAVQQIREKLLADPALHEIKRQQLNSSALSQNIASLIQ